MSLVYQLRPSVRLAPLELFEIKAKLMGLILFPHVWWQMAEWHSLILFSKDLFLFVLVFIFFLFF